MSSQQPDSLTAAEAEPSLLTHFTGVPGRYGIMPKRRREQQDREKEISLPRLKKRLIILVN